MLADVDADGEVEGRRGGDDLVDRPRAVEDEVDGTMSFCRIRGLPAYFARRSSVET